MKRKTLKNYCFFPPLPQIPKSLLLYSLSSTSHHRNPPPPPPSAPIQLQSPPEDGGPTLEEVFTRITQKQSVPQHGRQNSDTKPASDEVPVRLPAKMKKSANDKSTFNHFEVASKMESTAVVEEMVDEVDVRAGDFINRFREHLKMQRLASIVRYKDMITRGNHKWFPKRFLHPDIVAPYDYIFIWDEDLGLDQFDAEKYIDMVKKYGLEILQPGLEPYNGLTWKMTERKVDSEVHKETTERPGWCTDPHLPPCAGFVEITAPVFSREAWHCVWNMIQNDLVHGWGLDFALQKFVQPPHEKISKWIVNGLFTSELQLLVTRVKIMQKAMMICGEGCEKERHMFKNRLEKVELEEQAKNIKGS